MGKKVHKTFYYIFTCLLSLSKVMTFKGIFTPEIAVYTFIKQKC